MLGKIEKMICKECNKERLATDSGVCLLCDSKMDHGTEVFQEVNTNMHGTVIKSKSGSIKENLELSKYR